MSLSNHERADLYRAIEYFEGLIATLGKYSNIDRDRDAFLSMVRASNAAALSYLGAHASLPQAKEVDESWRVERIS